MKGIVWGSTFESASQKLTQIINEYVSYHCDIDQVTKTKTSYYVTFVNGDMWRAISAKENARGARCNVSYVERNIDYDIYRTIIEPCTSTPPFAAIKFYGEGNLHITDTIEPPF